jgi:predicted Holliday junction resolvase-like endonuclease
MADSQLTPNEPEQEVGEHWHLDKKVPLSLIFAMLVQAVMVIVAVQDIKKDVEVLKMQMTSQRERDERQDKAATEAYGRLSQQLERMDAKLDRIVEKYQK